MKKIAKLLCLVFGLTMILMLSACGTSNEPCVYCEKTPTKSYKTATGDTTYICKEHRSTCFFCNKKATKHYTSGLGLEIFTCKDCYKEATK